MIVYHKFKDEFLHDVANGMIADIVEEAVEYFLHKRTGRSEYKSWEVSLEKMYHVLNDVQIPGDSGIAIEYNIPRTNNRIDIIISGYDSDVKPNIIVIELKQWDKIEVSDMDGIVSTRFSHGTVEHVHPSYQAWSYASYLENYNIYVYETRTGIYPCAYLHNYKSDGKINDPRYEFYINKAPIFTKGEVGELQNFVKQYIKIGDKKTLLYKIEKSELKPSKILAETLVSLLAGNKEFIMIDEQKIIYEESLKAIGQATKSKKKVIIVHGGPGTGKSVIAINLLVKMIADRELAQYVTKNSAPRAVFSSKLLKKYKKNYVNGLFKGSGNFFSLKNNYFKALIVDEAHRLNEKSGLYGNLGENQIKELIHAAQSTIFFIDEDQRVTLSDIGSEDEIKKYAEYYNADTKILKLNSQFRCSGSDAFLSWLDNTLQIRDTANILLEKTEHEFQIFDNPNALFDAILEKNKEKNSARVVAGYCWNWISKRHPELFDINFPEYGFNKRWNLTKDGSLWIDSPDSVSEIGCIHTCQGLELEYIGVIVGPDLIVRNNIVKSDPSKRAKTDQSIRGWRRLLDQNENYYAGILDTIVKNTYRTLMTRGMKACYVYFTDKETANYFRSRLNL